MSEPSALSTKLDTFLGIPKTCDFVEDPTNIFYCCVEGCSEAIMIIDAQQRLKYVNPAWCRIYGYTKKEVLGKTPALIKSNLQETKFYQQMWKDILDPHGNGFKGELVNRAKDGTLIPVMLTISRFFDGNGITQGYMGLAVDISARRQLEAELIHQDRLASVGVLASGLAHEIGTPLGVIRGRAEIIEMSSTDEKTKSAVGVIISQIDRITQLIKTLLSFSLNTTDVNLNTIEIKPLISEVILLLADKLKSGTFDVKIDIKDGVAALIDANRLQQILMNLIINAAHAIDESIQFSAGKQIKRHFIKISARQERSNVFLVVEDSGIGISPPNLKKIFQPFFTTKEPGHGTGLGLSIVPKLLSEIGAHIGVESTLNEGTVFTIILRGSKS